nr:MAG TPA: hypothetical protein [Caudoviricetes sp.]
MSYEAKRLSVLDTDRIRKGRTLQLSGHRRLRSLWLMKGLIR